MRLLTLILLTFSLKVSAAGPHACAGDVQKFCQGVPKTRQALDKCLDKNIKELGSSCKAVRENFTKEMKEKNKCYADMKKFCANEQDLKGINKCLQANIKNLSKECLTQKDQRRKERLPCEQDQAKLCSKDKLKGNSLAKCMFDNSKNLSKACSEARNKFEAKILKKQPCFNDAINYCDKDKKDPAKLEQCLGANSTKLSPLCTKHRKAIDEKISARNPCYQDAKKYCAKERFRPELLKSCLQKNEAKLSTLCQDTRKLASRQQKSIQGSCAGDEKKFCSSVPKKGAAIISCLKANLGKISFQCKKAITD